MFSDLLAGSGPDDEITEDEFNEALRRSGKDTAPGPDKVRYSDFKNLTYIKKVYAVFPTNA